MWMESSYRGAVIPFAQVLPQDEYLHAVPADAPFDHVETNLYGFNIPAENINSNIYVLWHPVLHTMSIHVFVHRGARVLPHQLAADYFNEHLYLPAVTDNRDWRANLGSCTVRFTVLEPLRQIRIECADSQRQFALRLECRAALPPVGRPGGKHFTQLMRTSGQLRLDGRAHVIDGFYMRDRSWSYRRPEAPERMPPYRWMTGWFGDDCAFVVAWLDTGLLGVREFGEAWAGGDSAHGETTQAQRLNAENTQRLNAENKWESGGPTPSVNFRSGWIAVDGVPRPIIRMSVRTRPDAESRLQTREIELELEDERGERHRIRGETISVIPKLYWGNLLTYMHFMRLTCAQRTGHGDLMDTYSTLHIVRVGI